MEASAQPVAFSRRLASAIGVDGKTVLPAIARGLIVSIAVVVNAISYPSLIFSGDLQIYSGIGVGLGLISAFMLTLFLMIGGSQPGTVAVPQSEPAIVLGVIAADMAPKLISAGAQAQLLPTLLAAVVAASALVGLLASIFGALRIGNVIRYIPYPVVVGFVGGMGWLLISGAFRVITTKPLALANLEYHFDPETLVRWLPAAAVGVFLMWLQHHRRHVLNVPLVAIALVVVFWGVMTVQGRTPADLAADGWLLSQIQEHGLWVPAIRFVTMSDADVGLLLSEWPHFLTLVVVSLMAVLMQASVIELAAKKDIDLNRELRAVGAGNLACAAFGALPGYHSLSGTTLAIRMGAPVRLISLVVALVCGALLLFGASAIAYLPRMAIGGLLFYVGLEMASGAVANVYLRRAWSEIAVAALVFSTVAFVGLIEGLAIGVAAGVGLFVFRYSQIDVVRRFGRGSDYGSNVVRSSRQREILITHAGDVLVFELQGYIFFGRSNALVRRIRSHLDEAGSGHCRFIVLDFRRVNGIDSSASMSVAKLGQYAAAYDFKLMISGLAPDLRVRFERAGLQPAEASRILFFPDLDYALESCEEEILADDARSHPTETDHLARQLSKAGGSSGDIARLMTYVQRTRHHRGDFILRQGEPSDDLLFVEDGTVSVRLYLTGERFVRLRTMGAGTVVGEIAFYLDRVRTAAVVADSDAVIARLNRDSLERMKRDDPAAAVMFHSFVARHLAEKLIDTTRMVESLHG